tara:strand:- start:54 stop:227 length:174 start_codon:yes stop_codon:yes gene_type:complete
MNVNKEAATVFSVSYRDEKIRKKLLNLQFSLWQKSNVKYSMEDVLNLLLDTYEKQSK